MSTETPTKQTPAPAAVEEMDLSVVDRVVARHGRDPGSAIPILQELQAHYRYLPRPALERVCATTDISPVQINGIATFYSQFRHMPVGEHLISVCHGTACHVAGAQRVTDSFMRHLGIDDEHDTDAARKFTVQKVACLGCCSLAPVVSIDGQIYGHVMPETVPRTLDKFLADVASGKVGSGAGQGEVIAGAAPAAHEPEFRVSLVSCCVANGTAEVRDALARELERLHADVPIRRAGCVGMCDIVPFIDYAGPDGRTVRYSNVTPGAVRNIVRRHVEPRTVVARVKDAYTRTVDRIFRDPAWVPAADYDLLNRRKEVDEFLGKQRLIVMEHAGQLDPLDLPEYLAKEGYAALARVLSGMKPADVVDVVERSELRGRGGGGYPTGRKWRAVMDQPAGKKYVVVNGDEGDPGAFMDRTLLEAFPHRVLEGVAIAAYAVGADEGYLYIRTEYPKASARVRAAILQAEEAGYLGEDILGTGFSLKLHVRDGAGAFVCGEETALLASIEGRRGTPRLRPPYPAQSGLWGRPTNVNNVETYANVPWIVRNGADEFRRHGTETSRGTKVFALAGAVRRGGLIEVPMGITIGEVVEDIGGGIPGGHKFKAVQIGGPSGGCVPASMRDLPIDYAELTRTGAMMGSGGIVVMDDTSCMVDIARYFLEFTQHESCGKCTFCRVGTRRMLEILERLCAGEASRHDLADLEELCERVRNTSLCGLGRTAPNPVLTTLRYFRHEYEAHIEGRCPAAKCTALISFEITDRCIGCTLCAQHCPTGAIDVNPYKQHEIDQEKCVRCGTCKNVCPADAVEVE